jgi:hypothetical protein
VTDNYDEVEQGELSLYIHASWTYFAIYILKLLGPIISALGFYAYRSWLHEIICKKKYQFN